MNDETDNDETDNDMIVLQKISTIFKFIDDITTEHPFGIPIRFIDGAAEPHVKYDLDYDGKSGYPQIYVGNNWEGFQEMKLLEGWRMPEDWE